MLGKVSVVITDSPLLLSLHYGAKEADLLGDTWWDLVMTEHLRTPSLNVFVIRRKRYQTAGRMQTESDAVAIDGDLYNLLAANRVPFVEVEGRLSEVPALADRVMRVLTGAV